MVPVVDTRVPQTTPHVDADDPADLGRLSRQLAAAELDRRRPDSPTAGRRWTKLLDRPDMNAWLIVWAPGSGLRLHDHGDASAGITVVDGALLERYTDRSLDGFRLRSIDAGTTISFGADHVHEIVNASTRPAVSIHVYAPALDQMTFYEEEWQRPEALARSER